MVEPRHMHPIRLTLLLLLPHHGTTNAQSPTQPMPPFTTHKMWDPSIAVIIGAIIGIFLSVAVFSLYLRRCTQQRSNNHPCPCSQRGIHPELLHSFPTLFFSTIDHLMLGEGALECAVCLTEFTHNDSLRLLPQCNHVFHPPCIDRWLSSHVTCPVCRANLTQDLNQVPVLLPTQLSANETSMELEGSGSRAEQGSCESEIERCPVASEEQTKGDEGKGSQDGASKSKLLGRSNSTGHSMVEVEGGESVERYTLRLPEDVRKYILLNHGVMQRSASYNVVMPRKGLRWSDSEGSSGKSSKRNSIGMRGQGSVSVSGKDLR